MSTQPPGNPKHAAYAAQILKLRRTQEFQLPRCFSSPPTRQVVTPDRPHPPVELVTIATRPEPASSSSAVPPICLKHRSAAVINGQQRFVTAPLELHYQPTAGGPRELPKLAVSTRLGRAGAANSRSARSATDKSGTQTPRSDRMPAHRRRSNRRASSTRPAAVRWMPIGVTCTHLVMRTTVVIRFSRPEG
jgi:hypothetical protein